MQGVYNPESLVEQLRKLKAGDSNARSYIKGSLQWLEKHPPNKHVVPFLKAVLEKFK